MKLYELTGAMAEALSTEDFEAVAKIEIERDEKLANSCAYYKNLEAERDAVANEIKRLQDRKKVLENKLESFKQYIASNLFTAEKWTNGVHKLSWRISESVEVVDEGKLPADFWREKTIREPDKAKIKAVGNVPGTQIITTNHLQIG